METGLKRTLNRKAIVLLKGNCNFLSPISPFKASANPFFIITFVQETDAVNQGFEPTPQ